MTARIVALALAAIAGCSDARPAVTLWHAYNGAEAEALAASAARWNAAHPEQTLELVGVPYASFADKLTSAIPGGNGPDLFIYPQDRIGDWADSGVLEPIEFWVDDARADRFTDVAVELMAYKGSLWGLPVATKSLALYYRKDLIAEPPRTTDDLVALAPKMHAQGGYALAYVNVDLYGHAPWLFGFGGKIVDDTGALAINTREAAAAMAFARDLVAKGIAPERAESPLVGTLFSEGKAATAISGPWFLDDIDAGVPFGITTLPIISPVGAPATPFLGAEGVLMSARAHDKDAAFAVMDMLTSDAEAATRAKLAHQVVPNRAVLDDPAIAADPLIQPFRAQLAHTVPMAKDPAMRVIWTPYQTALGEVLAGRKQPGEQLLSVEREVSGYLSSAPK